MSVLGRYYNELFRFVPLLEALLLFLSVYLGVYLRLGTDPEVLANHGVDRIWPEALMFTLIMTLAMTATGLYNRRLRERLEGIILRLMLAMVIGVMIITALFYTFLDLFLGRGILALALLCAFFGIVIIRALLGKALEEPENLRRVVILGTGKRAEQIMGLRRRTDLIGVRILGFVPINGETSAIPEERKLAVPGNLADWAAEQRIDELVVAPDERRNCLDMEALMSCRARGIAVTDVTTFIERETGCLELSVMTPGWFAFSNGLHAPHVGDRLKRLLDIVVSLVVLVLALPLIAGAALAIWLESGRRGPILYRQKRVGRNGQVFELFKFRSMVENAEQPGEARWAGKNDARVTRVGAILRRFRIDELPQLYNILRGDMSFVGPRPERPEFIEQLQHTCPHYGDRHRVKPGLTGWAQIRYPYGASENDAFQKLKYDLYYVKNRNVFLDLVILMQTAEVVLWGRGAR